MRPDEYARALMTMVLSDDSEIVNKRLVPMVAEAAVSFDPNGEGALGLPEFDAMLHLAILAGSGYRRLAEHLGVSAASVWQEISTERSIDEELARNSTDGYEEERNDFDDPE